jgi:transposase
VINSTIADICQNITPDALQTIIDRWGSRTLDWETLPGFTTLRIDEIALKKGHRSFVVIVTARRPSGELQLLAVLPDRTKETVRTWLQTIPSARQRQIQTVCCDLWEAYVRAVQEVLPQAVVVLDRFHVARHYRDAADHLRKQELKRLQQELPKNSGCVEGLNTKLKVLKRRCFGMYNLGHLFQRITLDLQGYRRFSPW